MDDPSVDVSTKDRAEILADLHDLGIITKQCLTNYATIFETCFK